jgi:hypothetical protein
MKWVTLDKKHYFLQDAALARIRRQAELPPGDGDDGEIGRAWHQAGTAYVRAWLESQQREDAAPRSPDLDPRRAEVTGGAAREVAGRILDAWCRLVDGRAFEVTYRGRAVIYVITPRLRINIPTTDLRRLIVEAGSESPTVLVDTEAAVIMLGLETAELSLIGRDGEATMP